MCGTKVVVRFRIVGTKELYPVRATLLDGHLFGSFRWINEKVAELRDGQLARFESVRIIKTQAGQ